MSSVAELGEKIRQAVEAEADEAEVEEEEEAEPEPEPEPDPEPLAAIGEEAIKKAERARDAQRKRLAGILGDDYVAHECMFCSGLGYTPEPPPVGARLTVIQTDDGLAFEAEPPPSEIPLRQAPDKGRCGECDGYGEILTGSRAPHGMVAPCSKCNGNGWLTVIRPEPPTANVTMTHAAIGQPTPGMIAAGTPDAWGRPAGHQHWGVPPAQIPG
jgi:hypothetical protein